ncbi:MAG TPA: 4-oxalocrotonate tautomerase [Clostridiaceae bacterium]|nr:4-oxalocrotonate tautomerase [Clostridiaceae bacterium]
MPHVIVKLFPGRTEEQKRLCTEKITQAIVDAIGADESSISVAFEEIPRELWKDTVYQPDIIAKENTLYKKPGYRMD